MKIKSEILVPGLVMFPIFLSMALSISPQPLSVIQLWQKIQPSNVEVDQITRVETHIELLSYQPWRVDLRRSLAYSLLESGQTLAALETFDDLAENSELSLEDRLLYAQALWENGKAEPALAIWNEIRNEPEASVQLLAETAAQLHIREDWNGTYQTLLAWQALHGEDGDILYQLGLYELIFDPKNAGETLLSALKKEPRRVTAIRAFNEILPVIGSETNVTYRLVLTGQALAQQGEWEYALIAFTMATRIDPEYAEGWAFLGNAQGFVGNDGYAALEKAYQLDPDSKVSRAMLATYWRNQRDPLQSLKIWQGLAEEDPYEPFWQQEMAETYVQMGEINAAFEAFQSATTLAPDDALYWMNLALFSAEYKVGLEDIGLGAARRAILLSDSSGEALDVMGVVLLALEDFTSAERFLLQSLEKQPYSALVHLHLGQMYLQNNQFKEANAYLHKCIDLAQNEEIRVFAQKLIAGFQ
ncbi:MAG: hypothetical protein CVU39_06730 [Chloroflexi bacterium HGW-Chloroflexi-10]|nr:MAG: hypothetical protein CVU39_06730 [Chloroflexi bacterium HGW-Chloroflexi-10]